MPYDTQAIKTELATLNQTIVQYEQPLWIVMTDNIDGAFRTLDRKLTAAGVMKVKDELQKQVDAYVESIQ
jgi:hypothetical protein